MGNVTLAFHLLCERANPASSWLPYIRSLPQEYDTPLFYQQDEVQLLLGTQAVQDILSQYKNTARQYAYFYKLVQVGRYTEHTDTYILYVCILFIQSFIDDAQLLSIRSKNVPNVG